MHHRLLIPQSVFFRMSRPLRSSSSFLTVPLQPFLRTTAASTQTLPQEPECGMASQREATTTIFGTKLAL
jgi:hypothetical protein